MEKPKTKFLYLLTGAMELCWLLAWASFLSIAVLQATFPFPAAIVIFVFAVVLTRLSQNRGWRLIQIIGLQGLGLLLAGVWLFHIFNTADGFPIRNPDWATEIFKWMQNPRQGLLYFFAGSATILLWRAGAGLAKRPLIYRQISSRFDLGLTGFFVLFLIKLLLAVRGGIRISDPVAQGLIFPFILLSIGSLWLVQEENAVQKNFLPGYRAAGVILGFAALVLLLTAGIFSFFFPYMVWGSATAYTLLKTAVKPLGFILLTIVRFMYLGGHHNTSPAQPSQDMALSDQAPAIETGTWMQGLEYAMLLGLCGLLALAGLIILCFLVYSAFLRLFAKTGFKQKRQNPFLILFFWLSRCLDFWQRWKQTLVKRLKGYKQAVSFYSALLRWGSAGRLPHLPHETPREYGLRLNRRFPNLSGEITAIIQAFHQEVYGQQILNKPELSIVRKAWRRLCSPRQWPARLKSRFYFI